MLRLGVLDGAASCQDSFGQGRRLPCALHHCAERRHPLRRCLSRTGESADEACSTIYYGKLMLASRLQVFVLEAEVLPSLQFTDGNVVTAYAYIDGKGVG